MIDVEKQVAFWRDGSLEDLAVAEDLVEPGRIPHGLFFAHLALEKALKALFVHRTQDLAPRLHNLVRLAQSSEISVSDRHLDLLAEMNAFNVEGRYPELHTPQPSATGARKLMRTTQEVHRWLMTLLN